MTNKQQAKKIWCFPTRTLIDLWPQNTNASLLADVFCVSRATISRWRNDPESGLTIWQADKYAIKLGMHPSEIWTDWYDKQ